MYKLTDYLHHIYLILISLENLLLLTVIERLTFLYIVEPTHLIFLTFKLRHNFVSNL